VAQALSKILSAAKGCLRAFSGAAISASLESNLSLSLFIA